MDPFERMHHSRGYGEWMEQRLYMAGPSGKVVGALLKSFKDFPPSQVGTTVQLDDAFKVLSEAPSN